MRGRSRRYRCGDGDHRKEEEPSLPLPPWTVSPHAGNLSLRSSYILNHSLSRRNLRDLDKLSYNYATMKLRLETKWHLTGGSCWTDFKRERGREWEGGGGREIFLALYSATILRVFVPSVVTFTVSAVIVIPTIAIAILRCTRGASFQIRSFKRR